MKGKLIANKRDCHGPQPGGPRRPELSSSVKCGQKNLPAFDQRAPTNCLLNLEGGPHLCRVISPMYFLNPR